MFSLETHAMTTKKEKCLQFNFILCPVFLLFFFFSSDDYKELLVCIKNRHFHLCLGRFAFLLNNAEPAFQQLWLDYTLPVLSYFSLFTV